jgi:DNA-binding transcriptional MerR regulator
VLQLQLDTEHVKWYFLTMETKNYSIAELEHLSGFPRRTIHFYVREKMISPASSKGGPAKYGEDHLLRLQMIRVLQSSHLRLDGIREALNSMDTTEMRRTIGDAEGTRREWDSEAVSTWVAAKPESHRDLAADHVSRVSNMLAGLKRAAPQVESWQRMTIADGIEVNLRDNVPEEAKKLLHQMISDFRAAVESTTHSKTKSVELPPQQIPTPKVKTKKPVSGVSKINTAGLVGSAGKHGLIDCHAARTVTDFLADIAEYLPAGFTLATYGKNWFMRDEKSSRVIDVVPDGDNRSLDMAGIEPGMQLIAKALPLWPDKIEDEIAEDQIRIDLRLMLGQSAPTMFEYFDPTMPLCDFLARIYYHIKEAVPPFTYGKQWLLRDINSGRVFDVGTAWAVAMGIPTDTRSISTVGITPGSNIEVVPVEIAGKAKKK